MGSGEARQPARGAQAGRPRRHSPRARFDAWVELRADGQTRRVSGRDLCDRGIGLLVEGSLPPLHETVSSEFALPGIRLPMALDGVVAWRDERSGRLGVRFLDVDPALGELLASYVAGQL